jgi:hypothetical protein
MEVKSIMDGSEKKKGTPITTFCSFLMLKKRERENDEKDKR